jgi:hypothetical protein
MCVCVWVYVGGWVGVGTYEDDALAEEGKGRKRRRDMNARTPLLIDSTQVMHQSRRNDKINKKKRWGSDAHTDTQPFFSRTRSRTFLFTVSIHTSLPQQLHCQMSCRKPCQQLHHSGLVTQERLPPLNCFYPFWLSPTREKQEKEHLDEWRCKPAA